MNSAHHDSGSSTPEQAVNAADSVSLTTSVKLLGR